MLWPNSDAGGDDISRGIRVFRENKNPEWLHLFKNLPTQIYIHLMNTCSCLIGNSSSGVREGAFIGTPVVNIGTRQNKRLRTQNVIQVDHNAAKIAKIAYKNGTTLKEEAIRSKLINEKEYDKIVNPKNMLNPK